MNRRIILTAFAAVIAATMTTTALAASDAKNPKAMVLQKSDFPAGARLTDTWGGKYSETHEWAVSWAYKIGAKQFSIDNEVVVLSPRLVIAIQTLPDHGLPLSGRQITLPKYGDEQVAGFSRKGNNVELSVLTGRVSWHISVEGTDGVVTKAELIAQLKRYAPKVMKRVGSG